MSSSPVPSPPPNASLTVRGLVSLLAQSFKGLKNFVDGLLWRSHQVRARAVADLTIYVDGVNGDDANDGLTVDTAVQTIEGAHQRVPQGGGANRVITIKLAGVGGFDSAATSQLEYHCETMLLPDTAHAENQRFHYRGPQMVSGVPTTGPNTAPVLSVTNLWWSIGDNQGLPGVRGRVESLAAPPLSGSITAWVHAGTRIYVSGALTGWTVNDVKIRFLRLKQGDGRKLIFEVPVARNGAHFIDVDLTRIPNGTKLSDVVQVGHTLELVQPGARLRNTLGTRINIEGHGGGQGVPGDYLGVPSSRGGGGFWIERLAFGSSFMAGGCFGLSRDRCDFGNLDGSSIGDENCLGGSGVEVNCLHTSLGVLLHGSFHQLHDSANCRPDVAADDATADPVYQDVDAFSCWGVLRNNCHLYVGSGTSTSPAFFTLERHLSIYDATSANPALIVGWGGRFKMLDQRNRGGLLQGDGDIGIGVYQGSQAFVVNAACFLLGNAPNYNDCDIKGLEGYKTWDEWRGGGTLVNPPSGPADWISPKFNRLTQYNE